MPLPIVEHRNPFASIEADLRADDASYAPPSPVDFDADLASFKRSDVAYGHVTKDRLFTLDPAITMINHGSCGACATPVLAVRSAYLALQEREPLKFFEDLGPRLVRVIRVLAAHLEVPPMHVHLVPNASSGTTSVLRSLPLTPTSSIVSFDLGYGAVTLQIAQVCAASGARSVVVPTSRPYTHARILDAFRSTLDATPSATAVVVDHITSSTGIILPIEEILAICRARNILTIVDGAHAIGQVPIDLTALQPDFYISNLHKWMLAPKSVAFLYIRDVQRQGALRVQPSVVSHGYGGGYGAEFGYLGTLDYSAWLAVPASLAFHAAMGGDALMQRNHELCVSAAKTVAAAWETSLLVDDTQLVGSFCVVVLPSRLFAFPLIAENSTLLRHALLTLHLLLRRDYQIEAMCMLCDPTTPGIRIAAQMYNQASDYDKLSAAVLDLIARSDVTY
ncbi:hypothetical protein SDRG_01192 [Saprolegnia diclina VS20]|uniref:Aminotransferase class V domain-containing protein n=1 Tax=Saprolegnia diclina (strain VS20) TaxID=1156394 RepID=T0SE92_SAPDV|nr:hypothetical protein SDRG_01192 [Saprolegnia diclina VS20]EQC41217.1 hypothetical protein SDRG_01192 [Saprolegnia diclina VS20]|eukprot:XP_008604931.1 hypothetical protein SDRG_01192 [Saprolegnia diclina VS20]